MKYTSHNLKTDTLTEGFGKAKVVAPHSKHSYKKQNKKNFIFSICKTGVSNNLGLFFGFGVFIRYNPPVVNSHGEYETYTLEKGFLLTVEKHKTEFFKYDKKTKAFYGEARVKLPNLTYYHLF